MQVRGHIRSLTTNIWCAVTGRTVHRSQPAATPQVKTTIYGKPLLPLGDEGLH